MDDQHAALTQCPSPNLEYFGLADSPNSKTLDCGSFRHSKSDWSLEFAAATGGSLHEASPPIAQAPISFMSSSHPTKSVILTTASTSFMSPAEAGPIKSSPLSTMTLFGPIFDDLAPGHSYFQGKEVVSPSTLASLPSPPSLDGTSSEYSRPLHQQYQQQCQEYPQHALFPQASYTPQHHQPQEEYSCPVHHRHRQHSTRLDHEAVQPRPLYTISPFSTSEIQLSAIPPSNHFSDSVESHVTPFSSTQVGADSGVISANSSPFSLSLGGNVEFPYISLSPHRSCSSTTSSTPTSSSSTSTNVVKYQQSIDGQSLLQPSSLPRPIPLCLSSPSTLLGDRGELVAEPSVCNSGDGDGGRPWRNIRQSSFSSASLNSLLPLTVIHDQQYFEIASANKTAKSLTGSDVAANSEQQYNHSVQQQLQPQQHPSQRQLQGHQEQHLVRPAFLPMFYPSKRRRRLLNEETEYLIHKFKQNDKPTTEERAVFAETLGIDKRTIQVWFQNRRAKIKKDERMSNLDPEREANACDDEDGDGEGNVNTLPVFPIRQGIGFGIGAVVANSFDNIDHSQSAHHPSIGSIAPDDYSTLTMNHFRFEDTVMRSLSELFPELGVSQQSIQEQSASRKPQREICFGLPNSVGSLELKGAGNNLSIGGDSSGCHVRGKNVSCDDEGKKRSSCGNRDVDQDCYRPEAQQPSVVTLQSQVPKHQLAFTLVSSLSTS